MGKDRSTGIIVEFPKWRPDAWEERWVPLEYRNVKPNMYEVSTFGRIRNINTGNEISICLSEKGYSSVSIMCTDGIQRTFKLHRIVATNFIGDYSLILEVNHKDGVKTNCHAVNLEWTTREMNIRHAIINGLLPVKRGEEVPGSKFSEELIISICEMMQNGKTNKEILAILKDKNIPMNRFTLFDLRHKRSWKHITERYEY